jgi:hypothetical protein
MHKNFIAIMIRVRSDFLQLRLVTEDLNRKRNTG